MKFVSFSIKANTEQALLLLPLPQPTLTPVIFDIDIVVLDRHQDLQHELDPGVLLFAPAALTLDVEDE
jgi:hypothetical protein